MSDNLPTTQDMGELLFYQTEDGDTRVQVRFQDDSVWLSQTQMTELFSKDKRTISEHIQNVFDEGELREDATVRKFRTVQIEGSREVTREISYYNLDVIISVGYRVKSHRGTQFRIWATQRLREYLIKGFAMDAARLKEAGGGDYFEELLARIRDIRSSEKVFWRKVLDIYATSIDYDPNVDTSQRFFKIVQNKMHWAAHGRTAAEVIKARADASKPQMGLTSLSGKGLTRTDAQVAKNYLNVEELDTLNRIVAVYLEFAELQAKSRRTMTMQDWISKLDDFLRISDRETLTHAGSVTH
ncbi:MAG: virulence RhuM family protein, partial [Nitrosomonadaceae bacterium]|nr:virulence RhuM family protein [Nitrosomonadaceae bacterium]